eukprot:223656-Lingulodinium_polyedra.AAC.1
MPPRRSSSSAWQRACRAMPRTRQRVWRGSTRACSRSAQSRAARSSPRTCANTALRGGSARGWCRGTRHRWPGWSAGAKVAAGSAPRAGRT